MKVNFTSFLRDEEGATAIEYGLIAGLIAIAIIAGATLTGTNLAALFNKIGTTVQNIVTPAATTGTGTGTTGT
jgi:pilus assembly protein Flp/PilA